MGSFGVTELIFILLLALIIFGPRRLPQIGRTLGRALGEFRRATADLKRTLDTELTLEETRRETPEESAQRESAPADDTEPERDADD